MLRALALLTVLGVNSAAGAVEAAFHLCDGAAQFDLTCCCSETTPVLGEGSAGCCSEISADRPQTVPAISASVVPWPPPPLAVVETSALPLVAPREPIATDRLRARGVHRATAPPLFTQHCAYLI